MLAGVGDGGIFAHQSFKCEEKAFCASKTGAVLFTARRQGGSPVLLGEDVVFEDHLN